ncbi:MAG: hypothetical protein ACJATA_002044 [Sphingobacteriales bacterium]|jgi:hypothetical protein
MDKTQKATVKGGWPVTVDKDCTGRFDICNPESVGRAFRDNDPGALTNCYHD